MKQAMAKIYSQLLDDTTLVLNKSLENCVKNGLSVLKYTDHKFHPQGYTAVILLAESHIALHTYPELDTVYMDIFCCNDSIDIESVLNSIATSLEGKILDLKKVDR